MHSAAEAKAYAQELYHLMRYANISDANLYYGNMRFDVNVSLRPVGSKELGTRTESKNLNSFRAVYGVVEHETKRQAELLDRGEKVVQETRGWDENNNRTFSQRTKEEAQDYRYFPEPDLPPLVITKKMLDEAKKAMPAHMPNDLRKLIAKAGIQNEDQIEVIVNDLSLAKIFVAVAESKKLYVQVAVAKWLAGEFPYLLKDGLLIDNGKELINGLAGALIKLAELQESGKLSTTAAKQVLGELVRNPNAEPLDIAKKLNLLQLSDSGALEKIVDEVIAAYPKPVADYQAGETKAMGFLVGQVMKASKGQANPPMVNAILKEKLGD